EQLDFKHCYSSALAGYAIAHLDDPRKDMTPLFDLMITAVKPPQDDINAPFLMQAMTIGYDQYVGRQATGRILDGKVVKGQKVIWINQKGEQIPATITRVEGYRGIKKIEFQEGIAGDIVSLSGVPEIMLGDTLCDPAHVVALPPIKIDEPTM